MKRIPVSSSSITSVGYDPGTETLEIEFVGGGVYRYFGVPHEAYEALMASDSLGRFVNTKVKEHYRYVQVSEITRRNESGFFSNKMDMQSLEQFKVRLAQTIFWCGSRADKTNPATSLRTAELRPRLLEENRSSAVDTVADARELFGGVAIRKSTIPSGLAGGRLLIYFPNHDLSCGAAHQQTDGFFDLNNVPPWDTWVAYFQDEQPNIDSFDTEYLIAWVPPEFVELADEGIAVNPEQCIQWLSDTSVELAKALRAENLLE